MEKKEKKNNNKGLIAIIVILTLLVLGLGGYTIYDKQMEKKDTKEEKTKTEEVVEETAPRVDLPLDDNNVVNLFNTFRIDNAAYKNINDLNTSNTYKLRLAYENIPNTNHETIKCSEIGAFAENGSYCGELTTEMWAIYDDRSALEKAINETGTTQAVKANLIKAKVLELFGKNYNYKDESFGLDNESKPNCHIMDYDQNKQVYAYYNCEGGGTYGLRTEEISEAYTKGDNLYIVSNYNDEVVGNKKNTYEFTKEDGRYIFSKATQE